MIRCIPVRVCLLFATLLWTVGVAAAESEEKRESGCLRPVRLERVKLHGFWRDQANRMTEQWIPHCIEQMEEGGRGRELLNFVNAAKVLADEPAGKFTGHPWSDAYVYNTIESICLALAVDPEGDAELAEAQSRLRRKLDEWIPIVLAAQTDDGYIHTFQTVNEEKRYENMRLHELYVQGYLLEAGVAHYRTTGGKDRRLYDAAVKCADQLCETLGPAPKRNWVHGHAGMGYALCRLARLTNEIDGSGAGEKYYQLARFLVDNRHKQEEESYYNQWYRRMTEMQHALGHAVHSTYFYTGIAEMAMLSADSMKKGTGTTTERVRGYSSGQNVVEPVPFFIPPAYLGAADRLWRSAVHRKFYVTGGVGALHKGEAFGPDYELPNNGYCESCAGCGLALWADRMHRIHRAGHYVDVQERVLYNNILGAVDLTGRNFFYQNPPTSHRARHPWHGCPCCVGNIPRTLLTIKDRMYSLSPDGETLYVNHFVAGEAMISNVAGTTVRIQQQTEYPWQGRVSLVLTPQAAKPFTLKIRIPNRAESDLYTAKPDLAGRFTVRINGRKQDVRVVDGYVSLKRTWKAGDRVDVTLPMGIQRIYADPRVKANVGRVALQRGPLIYNIENVDNKADVRSMVLPDETPLKPVWKEDLLGGVMAITCDSPRLLAVPNYARLNRGGLSLVWIAERPEAAENIAPKKPAR